MAWTLIPRESLARAEVVRGGGATAWGNAALGGVVQLFTAAPDAAETPARFAVSGGDFSTRSAELQIGVPAGRASAQLLGRAFATNGFRLVAPERRGPIDIPAASRHSWAAGRWLQPLSENLTATFTARTFSERRNNGTPYQRNTSRANFGSVGLVGQPAKNFAWNAVAYAEEQNFSSTFSSVNATRTAETPASDQFAVPATALGAAWTGAWTHADAARTSLGVDARRVRGETREHFTFVSGAFTRLRVAGGAQQIGGLFALHERPLAPGWRFLLGGRLDGWREHEGHRRESDRITGVASRDEHYPDRRGTEVSPSAGLVWTPLKDWRLRLAGQQAFRRPTLNELYRPFRQGANVTESNPLLRTERVTTGEVGAEWSSPGVSPAFGPEQAGTPARHNPPAPAHGLTLGATAFWNDLRDAVGNVTLARGPGNFPLFGNLAAGGVGRQRLNLDRIRVRGVEFAAQWQASRALGFTADGLYNDATVTRATAALAIVGKRVAQVPRLSSSVGATWQAPGKFTLTPRLRWIGRQFEDDENQLILGEVVVADLGVSRPVGKHLQLFLSVENVGNARIETGRSADGVVNVGTPRLALGGIA